MSYPAEGEVFDGIVFGPSNEFTGNRTDAPEANVQLGTMYGPDGNGFEGTLDGSITLTEASVSSIALASASAVLDAAPESGLTVRTALRLLVAALAGKISGASGSTITIRSFADNKNRIIATVDADGNRSAITYDLT